MASNSRYMKMELTQEELLKINSLLPSRYLLEISQAKNPLTHQLKKKTDPQTVKKNNQTGLKRPARERKTFTTKDLDPSFRSTEGYKKLSKVLQSLKKNPLSEPFLTPVSQSEFPDYSKKIQHPMDLSKIESKLKQGLYESGYDFALDVRLIWINSFLYNHKNPEFLSQTIELCSFFEDCFKGCEFLAAKDNKSQVIELYKKIDKLSKGIKNAQNKGSSKPQARTDRSMSLIEKKTLCQSIKELEPKHLKGVLEIVKECMDVKGEELEFDIDKLPSKVCRELDGYVKKCLAGKDKIQKTCSGLKELDSKLESLAMQTRGSNGLESLRESQSESSSSEGSDLSAEKDWRNYRKASEDSDHSNGFGSMMDFDKIY